MIVEAANRPDFKLAKETLEALIPDRPQPTAAKPQGMCLDKGYDFAEIYDLLEQHGYTPHVRYRGEGVWVRAPEHQARRWVVERTHSWLHRFRAVLIRWNKKADNFLGLLHLACGWITLKQAGLLG